MTTDPTSRGTSPRRADPAPNAAPLRQASHPKAGFSQAELQAAARVIANEVRRVSARYTAKRTDTAPSEGAATAEPMRKSSHDSP